MLYFVATPIGNLADITLRALETLKIVDVIACEDTRKTQILLGHYGIKKRTIMHHKNNEAQSTEGIIALLQSGQNVAVVSDAGMPVISDPGSTLILALQKHNLPFTIIPGPSACLSALVLSGFCAKNFLFVGFLPAQKKAQSNLLTPLKHLNATLIFYVAPHDIETTLATLFETFGARNACLVKEITKVFESTCHFVLGQQPNIVPKGEFVLLLEGAGDDASAPLDLPLEQQVEFYMQSGLSQKEALKVVAKANKIKNIYTALNINKKKA